MVRLLSLLLFVSCASAPVQTTDKRSADKHLDWPPGHEEHYIQHTIRRLGTCDIDGDGEEEPCWKFDIYRYLITDCAKCDIDGSGGVGVGDLLTMMSVWGCTVEAVP
jgi:hypothetical protein